MKKIYLSLIALLLLNSLPHAQLNYAFTATTATYQPVVGGITPFLVNRPFEAHTYSYTYDEGFANDIPIGFTFNYNGTDYTTINANTNGFTTLGEPLITDSAYIENYYANNLTNGNTLGQYPNAVGVPYRKTKPILAPLWDDLDLITNSNFRYITTGSPGSRIFTIEWAQVIWQFDAGSPELSFELKLYEGTNVIEFAYHDEGGTPSAAASASIGITDAYNLGTLISLQNTSSNPAISNIENSGIYKKPADNQVYRFTPLQYAAPLGLKYTGYTNNKVSFKWNATPGATGYEYAVTTSSALPASGTATSVTNATAASLMADEDYYVHVRASFGTDNFSSWSSLYFKSANDAVTLPYSEGFESAVVPALPENTRAQVIDSLNYYAGYTPPDYQEPIATYNDGFADHGVNYLQLNANLNPVPTYFYLPGVNLTAGTTYKLHFKYYPGYFYPIGSKDTGLNHLDALNIKSGMAVGADSATTGLLNISYRDVDLSGADANLYLDTFATITPATSGTYYLSFEFMSGVQKDSAVHYEPNFTVAAIDDISLSEITLPVTLLNFSGEVAGKKNILHWTTTTEHNNTGFEVQRCADGFNFNKIAFVKTQAVNGNSNSKLNYNFPDFNFLSGANYYRLKQIDKDGKFSYSDIVVLRDVLAANAVEVYPVPAKNTINVKVNAANSNNLKLSVTDISGKSLYNKTTLLSNGETLVQINVSRFATGTYFLKLASADGSINRLVKFVKE